MHFELEAKACKEEGAEVGEFPSSTSLSPSSPPLSLPPQHVRFELEAKACREEGAEVGGDWKKNGEKQVDGNEAEMARSEWERKDGIEVEKATRMQRQQKHQHQHQEYEWHEQER